MNGEKLEKDGFFNKNKMPNDGIVYNNLNDEMLVSFCLNKDRLAWNEFFRRFTPIINKSIKRSLVASDAFTYPEVLEITSDIFEKVLIKLYSDGILNKCRYPARVRSWLWVIASHQTMDWLIAQSNVNNIPERYINTTMSSINAPMNKENGKTDMTLADTLLVEDDIDQDVIETLEHAIAKMEKLDNQRAYWSLRLSIIAHLSLTPEDISRLAAFNGMSIEDIQNKLNNMMDYVEKKFEKKIEAASKAVALWYRIRRMEVILRDGNYNVQQKVEAEQEISKYIMTRNNYLQESHILCRPSNEDIGELIGMPADKVDQVTNILVRARDALLREIDDEI